MKKIFSLIILTMLAFACSEDFLNKQPAVEETQYLRHVRFESPIVVKMDGKNSLGVVMKPAETV